MLVKSLNHYQYLLISSFVLIAFTGATSWNAILPFLILNTPSSAFPNTYLYGFIVAAFPLGQFISAYGMAFLASKKKILTIIQLSSIGTFFSSLMAALALFHGNLLTTCFFRFLSGCLEANVVLTREMIVASTSTEMQRNKRLGGISTAITLGFLLGPILNAYVYKLNPVLGIFFPCLMSLVLTSIAFQLPNVPILTSSSLTSSSFSHSIHIWISCLTVFFATDLFYQYIPLFLSLKFNFNVNQTGFSLFLVALSNAAIALFAYLPRKIMSYTQILMLAGFAFTINIFILSDISLPWLNFILALQGAIIAVLSNNLIFYFTARNSQARDKSNYLMSHIVSARALVSALSALLAGYFSAQHVRLPLYLSIIFISIFLLSLRFTKEVS